jgi:hypothetical protein
MPFLPAGVGAAIAGGVATAGATALIGGLTSSGNSSSGGASGAAAAADPFASQRGQYQQQLSALISNPSSITSTPGYQFGLQQSQNAVEGSAAANGMVNSGNVLNALSTNAQGYASTQLNNQELLLSQLAGANIGSPGTAGQILQGQNQTNQQSMGTLSSAIGGAVSTGVNSISNGFNVGSTSGTYAPGDTSTSVNTDNSGVYYNNGIN